MNKNCAYLQTSNCTNISSFHKILSDVNSNLCKDAEVIDLFATFKSLGNIFHSPNFRSLILQCWLDFL